jgi:hypothetical protein
MPAMRMVATSQFTTATGMPFVHRLENVGPTPYRVFAIENLRDSGWTTLPPIEAPGTTAREPSRAFALYDMRLNASTPRTGHTHQNPSFIFLIAGVVQVQGGGGESEFRLDQPGRWFPSSGPDQPHTIALASGAGAHVICVEAR